ncbi:hypothetical protein GOFOIKOB_1451 [Methylobacterium tardum]|uniref:Uncharacterized protein n=1 Tax=Methylobacterium tardum TaxID=374432 RepID=A0AA37TFS6_9HYPH|nr:hypothetical protein [Methylobacterium tardum]URD34590.1 hypothetical protein M6G65_18505 [Methylobacterium tardum]GJE48422.1 hypothetical protein GOFOIKOB_1451 [Methylobacterium tardum]GLS73034.1 hypothetical protein GCM10007890_50490 [Methylobacterium tardum]
MQPSYERVWEGTAWQTYAHRLVQMRHGSENVQRVPDRVQGDHGLEFFTTDGCLFQCYAPEETVNTAKASSAMKNKATRDLGKVAKNASAIEILVKGIDIRRWFLLCPFLDDKSVVTHVRNKGKELAGKSLPFIHKNFEALVHSQDDFASEIENLRRSVLGPQIQIPIPDAADVALRAAGDAGEALNAKLSRAFPQLGPAALNDRAREFVRGLVYHENTMERLKRDYPNVWEQAYQTIDSEESRLRMVGADGSTPIAQLKHSLDRIEDGLRKDLPTLPQSTKTHMAQGVLASWLVRCPLDFS